MNEVHYVMATEWGASFDPTPDGKVKLTSVRLFNRDNGFLGAEPHPVHHGQVFDNARQAHAYAVANGLLKVLEVQREDTAQ